MDDDQQFCLRWNNHQSTLVAVFDTLLEHGTLVDCTLAAEGKFLNAHRVVLSACSPYFAALLEKHFDKHPVLILKDVKFQELKAMMDYMYRGEVNISQDQLGALLKAAESLQIKGLSDNKKGETTERKPSPSAPPPKSPQPVSTLPKVQGLTIEQRAREDSREGSMSPGPRKKKRLRRKSEELDNHDASNSSESHSLPAQSIPMLPAITKMNADVPDQIETKSEILTRHKQIDDNIPQVPIIKEKIETHTELMLEPKSEYVDEMNEDSIEDLTLDDDDLSNMEQVDDQAGPSHGAGEGSSQGFGGWHMGNQSQDEVFLAAQEAVGAHRDSQDLTYLVNTETYVTNTIAKIVVAMEQQTILLNELVVEARNRRQQTEAPSNIPNVPIMTVEDFEEFEKRLKDTAFRKYMVRRLAAVGGNGVQNLTRRIMKYVLSNNVAIDFNWKGREKRSFEKTMLMSVIYDAAKTNYNGEENDYLVAKAVKEWLKYAKFRENAKK